MTDPGWELQVALYSTLNGNLSGLSGNAPVYDGIAPQGSSYPYVIIDGQNMTPDNPLNRNRDVRNVNLSIWSTYAGQKEVNQILGQIYALVHEQQLPMPEGYRMVRARVIRQLTQRDADGITYMGTCTIEARIEH